MFVLSLPFSNSIDNSPVRKAIFGQKGLKKIYLLVLSFGAPQTHQSTKLNKVQNLYSKKLNYEVTDLRINLIKIKILKRILGDLTEK